MWGGCSLRGSWTLLHGELIHQTLRSGSGYIALLNLTIHHLSLSICLKTLSSNFHGLLWMLLHLDDLLLLLLEIQSVLLLLTLLLDLNSFTCHWIAIDLSIQSRLSTLRCSSSSSRCCCRHNLTPWRLWSCRHLRRRLRNTVRRISIVLTSGVQVVAHAGGILLLLLGLHIFVVVEGLLLSGHTW